jgi:serum/glucocorticoid-regulated kinase 2
LRLETFLLTSPLEPKVGLKDFIFLKNIGVGGFSLVYLVRKKDTGKFYALKLIDKEFIIAKKK